MRHAVQSATSGGTVQLSNGEVMKLRYPEVGFRRLLTQTFVGRLLLLSSIVFGLLLGTAAIDFFVVGQTASYGQSVWDGVIHFVAPGTLANDTDVPERIIGGAQVLIGLVFYVGLLIAVINEGVSRSVDRFRSYEAPLHVRDHVLFVGAYVDLSFVLSALHADLVAGVDPLVPPPRSIVVMIPESARGSRVDLTRSWQAAIPTVTVRVVVGDAGSDRSYELACADTAGQVVICGDRPDRAPPAKADFEATRTMMAVADFLDRECQGQRPRILVDTARGRHGDAIASTSWGRTAKHVVGDRGLGARFRFAVMHPEFSPFFGPGGNSAARGMHVLRSTGHTGELFANLVQDRWPTELPIGILQNDDGHVRAMLPPVPGYVVQTDDHIAMISGRTAVSNGPPRRRARENGVRLLIVGWSAPTRELLRAMAARRDPIEQITILSRSDWRTEIEATELPPNVVGIHGDFSLPTVLDAAFAEADPDTIIVTSKFDADPEVADARTAFVLMRLRSISAASAVPIFALFARPIPAVLVDHDPRIVINSLVEIGSSALALAVSRYEVGVVMRDLLGGHDVASLRVDDAAAIVDAPTRFVDIYARLLSDGEVPVCAHLQSGELICPPSPEQIISEGDLLLIAKVDDQSASTSTLELGLHSEF